MSTNPFTVSLLINACYSAIALEGNQLNGWGGAVAKYIIRRLRSWEKRVLSHVKSSSYTYIKVHIESPKKYVLYYWKCKYYRPDKTQDATIPISKHFSNLMKNQFADGYSLRLENFEFSNWTQKVISLSFFRILLITLASHYLHISVIGQKIFADFWCNLRWFSKMWK